MNLRTGRSSTFSARVRALRGNGVPAHTVRQLTAIDALSVEIEAADKDVAQEAEQDEVCRRLTSVPGIGAITAIRFAAALDGVDRFPDAQPMRQHEREYSNETTRRSTRLSAQTLFGIGSSPSHAQRWDKSILAPPATSYSKRDRTRSRRFSVVEVEQSTESNDCASADCLTVL